MFDKFEQRQLMAGGFLQGTVFIDSVIVNNKLDPTEPYQSGATVQLYNSSNALIDTKTTGADGSYLFSNLAADTYKLVETPPSGYGNAGTQTTSPINPIQPGGNLSTIFVKVVDPSTLSVVYDSNQFFSNPNVGGIYYQLKDPNSSNFVTHLTPIGPIPITVTGPSGTTSSISYCVDPYHSLNSGVNTFPANGVPANPTLDTNVYGNIGHSGRMSYLLNHYSNTVDPVIGNALALAIRELQFDSTPDPTPVTTAAFSTGNYQVTGGYPGFTSAAQLAVLELKAVDLINESYGKSEQAIYLDSVSLAGSNFDGNQALIIPGSLNFANTLNISNQGTAALYGNVYVDTNNDGIFQGTETGIAGVTVTLTGTDNLANPVTATTTTNATGGYSFNSLQAGTYVLTETQPSTYLDGKDTIGTPGGTTTNDQFSNIVLGSGVIGVANNFGELVPSTLAGNVYVDTNNDGIFQGTESGISGATVTLTGTNDLGVAVSVTTTTNATGAYSFTGLRPGTYVLTETKPTGYLDGKDTIGTPGGTTGSDKFSNIVLNSGVNGVANNFGNLVAKGSITGRKYDDLTGNGLTVDDTGLGGVKIYLDTNNNGTLDSGEISTTTAVDGTYSFNNVTPGSYTVREVVGAGWIRTGPKLSDNYVVTVSAGNNAGGNDFANTEMCSDSEKTALASLKYFVTSAGGTATQVNDLRGNTNQNDLVTVNFTYTGTTPHQYSLVSYTAPSAAFDANTASQQQIYQISTIIAQPGQSYTLSVKNPNCYYQVDFVCGAVIDHLGPAGSNIFYTPQNRLISADNEGNLVCTPSTLSGFVYVDSNNNGVKDSTEVGIAGVTVTITGTDYQGNLVNRSTTTSTNGGYSFSNLLPGTYTLLETQPANYLDGKDTSGKVNGLKTGAAGNDVISAIDMIFNGSGVDFNFGELKAASLSGSVYADTNNDGIFQATETGIAGVIVKLTGSDDLGNSVSVTTTTNASGSYAFTGLRPGTYVLTETQPAGYVDGKDTIGSQGGTVGADVFSGINLVAGTTGINNNFGELKTGAAVATGATATIGFWHNNNGQALITSFNGGASATNLGNWLATTFSNLYGSGCGSNNLSGKTNSQVAAYFLTLFSKSGQKTEAQVLATALAVYATNSSLAGGTQAAGYGFAVNTTGTGLLTYNVGTNGSALGVSNNTTLTVMQILQATNSQAVNGVLYNGDTTKRNQANTIFDGINVTGDIAS